MQNLPRLNRTLISQTALCVCLTLGHAALASDEGNGWTHNLSTYLWVADTTTEVDSAESVLKFSDAVDLLDSGLILNYEGEGERFGFIADLIYVSLSDDSTLPGPFASDVDISLEGFIANFQLTRRFVKRDDFSLDLMAGLRIYALESELKIKSGPLTGSKSNADEKFIDAIIGARGRWDSDRFFAVLYGDIGTGDTDITWQVYATVGYKFNEKWSTHLGYAHLEWEFDDDVLDKQSIDGPLIGVTYRF